MHATASMVTGAYAGPGLAPSGCEAPAFPKESDCQSESGAQDGSCIKGFIVALGLEAATALCICGIWQVWHLIR